MSSAAQSDIVRQVPLSGTITSARVSRLSPEIAGQVKSVLVDIGDRVAAGDELLQVDDELARLNYHATQAFTEQVRAELADAKRRFEDAKRLRKQNSISENEILLRQAEVEIKTAALARQEAEARRQRAELERYTVKAPFAGVVSERMTEAGEWIEPGTTLFNLVGAERLYAEFAVPQAYYADIDGGSRVVLNVSALGAEKIPGRIHAVVPVSDPQSRTFLMRVLPDDDSLKVIPGMSVAGVLQVGTERQGVVVSRDAVLRYPDGRVTVWVVRRNGDNTTVTERHVTLGHAFDGKVEVRDGLQPGDTVVVLGNEALEEGQAVRIERSR